MKFTRALLTSLLVLTSLIVGAGIANAVTPLNNWRFWGTKMCVENGAGGSFYPAYFHTAANAYNDTPGVSVIWTDPVNGGATCAAYGYSAPYVIKAVLLHSSLADQRPCTYTWKDLNASGYHEDTALLYYNFWAERCRPDALGTDAIASLISKHMGDLLGLKLFAGGASYSVMNTDRYDIRWPTRYDTTNCPEVEGGSGMVRRYSIGCV